MCASGRLFQVVPKLTAKPKPKQKYSEKNRALHSRTKADNFGCVAVYKRPGVAAACEKSYVYG